MADGIVDKSLPDGQDAPLIEVTPSPDNKEGIRFDLKRNSQARSRLIIKNISNQPVAFKVKTTTPLWYNVKPNQEILQKDQTVEVSIILIDSERDRMLFEHRNRNGKAADKKLPNRFKVESRALNEEDARRITEIEMANAFSADLSAPGAASIKRPSEEKKKNEEFAKLWDLQKPSTDLKVKVTFHFENDSQLNQQVSSGSVNHADLGNNDNSNSNDNSILGSSKADDLQSGGTFSAARSVSNGSTSTNSSPSRQPHPPKNSATPNLAQTSVGDKPAGAVVSSDNELSKTRQELEALKTRFDAIVEYTVNLTTEREILVQQNEQFQNELNKEKERKKNNSQAVSVADASKVGTRGSETMTEKQQKGYTLFQVFLFALIGFLLGRFVR
jgi:hypothetical protein